MPGQRRHAVAGVCVPELHGPVIASTCDVLPVSGPCDGADPAVLEEMIQHTKHLRQGGKLDKKKKKNLTNLSARSTSTRTDPSALSRSSRCCRRCHLLFLCHLCSTPQTRPCHCDEMIQHTKQLRQGEKIR